MKISDYIANKIEEIPKGIVFSYDYFIDGNIKADTIIRNLNRFAESGKIKKLLKGKYFIPEESVFGNLYPDQSQIVKDLLESKGNTIGYLTGFSIFNSFGFTSQVSNIIQIGKNQVRPSIKRGIYTISFTKQLNDINADNIYYLQILDIIKYIKIIPDAGLLSSCKRLLSIISELSKEQKNNLAILSMKYNPAVRALLGAIFDEIGYFDDREQLMDSLNKITTYNYPRLNQILSKSKEWNIVH